MSTRATPQGKTCLITALPAEAKPLLHYFGLHRVADTKLQLFESDQMYLLQCGIGKLNAAIATATLMQQQPHIHSVINVGIAGAQHDIGTVLIGHSVQDRASGQHWYPHLPSLRATGALPSIDVVTVDKPDTNYTSACAFDMEAAGIAAAATQKLDMAFIQVLKVVSDNAQTDIQTINRQVVQELMAGCIKPVELLLQALPFHVLANTQDVDELHANIIARIHFTQTAGHALKRDLLRTKAVTSQLPEADKLIALGNAKAIQKMLLNSLDGSGISYLSSTALTH